MFKIFFLEWIKGEFFFFFLVALFVGLRNEMLRRMTSQKSISIVVRVRM